MTVYQEFPISYGLVLSHDKSKLIRIAGSVFVYSVGCDYHLIGTIKSIKNPYDATFSFDNKYFAVSNTVGHIIIFNSDSLSMVQQLNIKNAQDCKVTFYERNLFVSTGSEIWLWESNSNQFSCLLKNNNGHYCFSKMVDNKIYCYDNGSTRNSALFSKLYEIGNNSLIRVDKLNNMKFDKTSFSNEFVLNYTLYTGIPSSSMPFLAANDDKIHTLDQFILYLESVDILCEDECICHRDRYYSNISLYSWKQAAVIYARNMFIGIDMIEMSADFHYIAVAAHDMIFVWDCISIKICYSKPINYVSSIRFIDGEDMLMIGTWTNGYIVPLN